MKDFKKVYDKEMMGLQEEMTSKYSNKAEQKLASIQIDYLFKLGKMMGLKNGNQ